MTTSDALSNTVNVPVNAADNTTYVPVTLANETFTNTTVSTPWLFGNSQQSNQPLLTANNIDVNGSGALRLTEAKLNQAAFAIYDQAIVSKQNLSISFDFYQYGGTGADGIGLVFLDASKPNPTTPGGYGGSLAYAQRDGIAGLVGGVLGIGFDAYGNYPNPTEGRNEGTKFTPDTVSIRGSEASGYEYLTGNKVPFSLDNPGSSVTRDASYRKATVDLTQDGLLSVTVQADLNQDGDFNDTIGNVSETVKVIDAYDVDAINGELPDTFKIGFTGATGASTNIHEVRNFKITTCIPNHDPAAIDVIANVSSSGEGAINGLQATDPDGNAIVSYTITSLPDAAIGTLLSNTPEQGGVPIQLGTVIPADQINQLYFTPAPGFSPLPNTDFASFIYTATDSLGATDKTPAKVTLHSDLPIIIDPPDLRPETLDTTVKLSPGDTVNVIGLSGTDDIAVASFQITTLPDANQGTLFLGDPVNGGTAVSAGSILTADQIGQLYFQSKDSFTGSGFNYAAIDNSGQIDLTPATVTLLDPPRPGCKIGKRLKGNGRRNKLHGDKDKDMLMGKGGKDFLSGKDCADYLLGGRGDDVLYGGGKADRLRGGRRQDRLHGNQGDDIENGGFGHDVLHGGRGNDGLRGGRGHDVLNGKYGHDVLFGGWQNDDLKGGANHDLLRGNQQDDDLKGQRGADILNGGLGSDKVFGGVGADVLRGRRGNDLLHGGAGRDTLDGGMGNDVVVGSRQADVLTGGEGADRFIYNSLRDRGDRITDFEVTTDGIDLRSMVSGDRYSSSNPFADYVRLVQQGSSTVVSVDANGDLAPGGFKALTTLNNVIATSVGANNFVF